MVNIKNLKSKVYKEPYDIVILAGEDNAFGFGIGETGYEPDERIYELFRSESFNTKKNPPLPLRQYVLKPANVRHHGLSGFYLFFGKRYEKEFLRPGRKLLFIKTAAKKSGFKSGEWGKNEFLYLNMVDMAKRLKLGNPENKVVAVLWHQGETDILNGADKEFYRQKLSALIRGIRFELNMPYLPFIAGDLSEEWCENQENSEKIRCAIMESMRENDYCSFVSSKGLSGNTAEDCVHFSGSSNKILGERYFEEYKKIREK